MNYCKVIVLYLHDAFAVFGTDCDTLLHGRMAALNIINYFMGAGQEIALLIVSMIPIVELRGAIPIGAGMGMPWYSVLLISIIGNLLPVPIIILLGRTILNFLKKFKPFEKLVNRYEKKVEKNADKVIKYETIGLCLLVAVPLPGTGAWTGAVVASFLNLRMKRALPAIALGVVIAGSVMTLVSYGVAAVF